MTAPRDLLTSWSEALAEEIVAAGVRHAVVSPGSRSTPFVAAALAAGLQCDSVIDERAAGFFALGLVRATRRPVLLLCTSGTAPAHYLPAVLEAAQSELPLLVLSADRPLELMDCDAPQTIQQMNLFGEHVRGFFELGEPVEAASAVEAMSRRVALAVHRSRWPLPGPVHLNARAKKPLEPQEVTTQTRRARGRVRYGAPTAAPDPEQVRELARLLRRAERPLVTAGSGLSVRAAGAVASLVQTVNAVLAAEAASGARTLDLGASLSHFPLILESPRADSELAPDLVVQLGRAPIARRWPERLASWCEAGARHVVLTSSVPSDVVHTASEVVVGDLVLTMAELEAEAATEDGAVRSEWREAWASADERVRRLTETEHRAEPGSEAALARRLVDALGAYDASVLSLSNSLPVRLVDHQAGLLPAGMRVLSQRGVSGIDGLIAGLA
ncbi:MAG: 2-succinyl-5-enolpyruvyl-6-hydroxy-3-cyclohexene-1-carboxylic-acid synthase, partial [Acidobacteriota bacterium]